MEFSYHFQIDVDFLQEWHYCQPLFQGLPFDPSMVFFRLFSSFFGRFYKISIGATLFFFGLGFSGRIKGKKQKQKKFSVVSHLWGTKKGWFLFILSANMCPTQLAMPGVLHLGEYYRTSFHASIFRIEESPCFSGNKQAGKLC